ncbi:hypothetical protein U27_05832 [Candidatus Vecturithrix granuli]|uniref:Uncharacterized protein n=1 Tax=Vecturithrix granuli TaxID=1499967 RepID=A0A081C2Q2_VECG1|nr:hypothetical protein U27_05832 [Candidatus Vecturithrix granuli]
MFVAKQWIPLRGGAGVGSDVSVSSASVTHPSPLPGGESGGCSTQYLPLSGGRRWNHNFQKLYILMFSPFDDLFLQLFG